MLTLSTQQLGAMEASADAEYVRDLARYLREEHADAVRGLDDAELERRVAIGIARAERYDIDDDASVTAYVAIMFEVSPTFDEQPAIAAVLCDPSLSGEEVIDALWDRTSEEDWDEAESYASRAEELWRETAESEEGA